ncbi:MAG: hypothetical protein JNJ57_06045, partial [Saprospiraceae bacterium]|nr:hypothetical protein [Saprospiraceae bacterium]
IANQTIGASKPNENIEWWITDVHGKVVHDGAVTDMAVLTDEIWMERTAPGLYLLWIKGNSRLQVEQFAVIR